MTASSVSESDAAIAIAARAAALASGPEARDTPPVIRIHRYVFRETLGPTLVAFFTYTGFMLVRGLVQLSDLVLQSEQPMRDAGFLLALSVPHIVVLTIPVALLLGLLVGIGRMSADSELVALRSAGIDLVRLYVPIGLLCTAACATTLFLMLEVVPRTNELLYTMKLRLSSYAVVQRIHAGVFSPEMGGFRIYAERASNDRRTLSGLIVSDRSNPAEGERLMFARSGALESEESAGRLWLRLEDAVTHHVERADPTRYDRTSYAVQRVLLGEIDPGQLLRRGIDKKQLREQTLPELLSTAKGKRTPVESRMAWVEVHKKFSLPAACLVFGLVGLPLGIVNRRGGRAAGFAVSIGIVLLYYVLFAEGEARAIDGSSSPFFAMWLPNILLFVGGVAALLRVRKDRPLFPALPSRTPPDPVRPPDGAAEAAPDGAAETPRHAFRSTAKSSLLLDRYVGGRFLRMFALVALSILVLYVVIDYVEISDDIAKNKPGLGVIARYYEALIFPILLDVVPFAFLTAALVSTAALVRSSETTAILASGVSLHRATFSLVALAVIAGGGLLALGERVVPHAALESERLRNVILKRPVVDQGAPTNVWFRGENGRFFHAETFDSGSKVATGVSVLELDPATFRLLRRTDARLGTLVPGKGLLLEEGWVRSFGPDGDALFLKRDGKFLLDAPEASKVFYAGHTDPRQMSYGELQRFIEARRRAGAEVSSLSTGLYQKTAAPVSALLLTLIGLPFAFRFGRRGAIAGIGVALLLGLAYIFVSALLVRFGESGSLPPLLAAWGTNVLFGLGAADALVGVRT
jgi:LPS export ABC transporter permease LptG/LPS export ABC transporter permease LptF